MKQFETVEAMEAIPGLRRPKPGRFHTTCQLVTQARMAGFTLGITGENVRPQSNCGGVMGIDMPDAATLSRSEEHTSELQSLMRISYAVFCLNKKTDNKQQINYIHIP